MGWTRFFRRSRWDAERASEIESYIQMQTDENVARGMTPREARAAACRKFGNPAYIREEIYRMNSVGILDNFARDVVYGLRNLRKSPGFTAVAIISLALGIGANTAIFSLVDTLMLQSLPVRNPRELVQLGTTRAGVTTPSISFSFPLFEDVRDRSGVFAGVFGYNGSRARTILLDGQSESANVEQVGGTFFETLGVQPFLGRVFTSQQDRPGGDRLAVISYAYWKRRFAGDPTVLGKYLQVNNRVFSIVGVGPPWFAGIGVDNPADVWLPIAGIFAARPWLEGPNARNGDWLQIIGRLKQGMTPSAALPALHVLFAQVLRHEEQMDREKDPAQGFNKTRNARHVVLTPAGRGVSDVRRVYADPLLVLTTIVGVVLLIACANIANLSLARATARGREMAVRLAIGANRSRLVLQMLTDSMLLAISGGLAGLLFAQWARDILVTMAIGQDVSSPQFHPDSHVLGFTAAITVATGFLFGIGPALRAARMDLTPALRCEATSSRSRFRLPVAKTLVAGQISLSMMLVLSALLFVCTLQQLLNQDLGFQPESMLIAKFDLNPAGLLPVHKQLLDRVNALPGVMSATLSDRPMFGSSTWSDLAYPENAPDRRQNVNIQQVAPNFFETMQIPVMVGRAFTARDDTSGPKVALINEALARRFFPDGGAVGKRFSWRANTAPEIEIVGVVKDVKWRSLRESAPAFVYLSILQPKTGPSYAQGPQRDATLQIRLRGDAVGLREPVRREIRALNAQVEEIRTQTGLIEATLKQERLLAKLSGFFGVLGLLLAAVGLYGLMAYTVSQRTGEMGIRMALGARPGTLVSMVLRETAALVFAGVVMGGAAAYGVTGLIEKFLFGVTRTDPAMTVLAAAMLLAVGLLAAWLPALRASRISPMTALRHE